MRKFYDEGKRCGPVNYIDVYNMTAALAANPHRYAGRTYSMTYDCVHWGIEANLHKAQIILNALLSAEWSEMMWSEVKWTNQKWKVHNSIGFDGMDPTGWFTNDQAFVQCVGGLLERSMLGEWMKLEIRTGDWKKSQQKLTASAYWLIVNGWICF